jgi:hypothetical protein
MMCIFFFLTSCIYEDELCFIAFVFVYVVQLLTSSFASSGLSEMPRALACTQNIMPATHSSYQAASKADEDARLHWLTDKKLMGQSMGSNALLMSAYYQPNLSTTSEFLPQQETILPLSAISASSLDPPERDNINTMLSYEIRHVIL